MFKPTQISGAVLWLRADLGITLNGSNVSAWADQSGNGNHLSQGTAAKQPLYNAGAKPFISFDGGDVLGRASAVIAMSVFTYFIAMRQTTSSVQRIACVGGFTSGHAMYTATGPVRGCVAHGVAQQNDAAYTNDTDEVWCADRDGTTVRMFANGTQQAITNAGAVPLAPSALTELGGTDATPEYIGRLGEVIYYNRQLTDVERAAVTSYMMARWL